MRSKVGNWAFDLVPEAYPGTKKVDAYYAGKRQSVKTIFLSVLSVSVVKSLLTLPQVME